MTVKSLSIEQDARGVNEGLANSPSSTTALTVLSLTLAVASANAGEPDTASHNLALELRNPIADQISVHLENNSEFTSNNRRLNTLNLMPVIPFKLSKDLLLVTSTVIPYIDAEPVFARGQAHRGLGDITQSFYLSPSELLRGWVIGAGPSFQYPSATERVLGAGQWAAGPAAGLIKQTGGWTFGVLANHLWSFAGEANRAPVNATVVDPSISYTWKNDFSVQFDSSSTYDWDARQWTVPLTAGVSQVLSIGSKHHVSLGLSGRWYAEHPTGSPDWGVVFTLTFIFAK